MRMDFSNWKIFALSPSVIVGEGLGKQWLKQQGDDALWVLICVSSAGFGRVKKPPLLLLELVQPQQQPVPILAFLVSLVESSCEAVRAKHGFTLSSSQVTQKCCYIKACSSTRVVQWLSLLKQLLRFFSYSHWPCYAVPARSKRACAWGKYLTCRGCFCYRMGRKSHPLPDTKIKAQWFWWSPLEGFRDILNAAAL